MPIGKVVTATGLFKGLSLAKRLFLFITVFLVLVNGIVYGVEQKDIGAGFLKVGEQFINPVENSYESAKSLNEGNILDITGFLWSLYSLFIWIWVIKKVKVDPFYKYNNAPLIRYGHAIVYFILIQCIYLALIGTDLNVLWKMIWEIIKGIGFLFSKN